MSLTKKDPSLRVAANDPHLVSLGGGRLSTAVTIHYIPIGDMTIGSSPSCSVSLNGSGVRPVHCTIFREENNEVTIVAEGDARVLIDGNKISTKANLTQGAMITIGNSNYLRFNNPAEAQLMRSAMGSNERISMPQIDFTQEKRDSHRSSSGESNKEQSAINSFYESTINPKQNKTLSPHLKIDNIHLNNVVSPKVFTADSITVNAPAKDVLGPKYANFARNLIENHKNDKNFKNNSNYVNIPMSNEVLTKVNNTTSRNHQVPTPYDKYPKPGSYGGLQLFPMNGVNSEINTSQSSLQNISLSENKTNISFQEHERLEEIIKICSEYDRQNQSITSSPIVQNRIKTNGSLPREKKTPFFESSPQHSKSFFADKVKTTPSSGYENVRLGTDRRVEINGVPVGSPKTTSGYENVIIGKYVPQSPRTKIRTTCMSPKKDNAGLNHTQQSTEYAQLIQSFEEKLRMEIEAIQDSGRLKSNPMIAEPQQEARNKRSKNVNNLTLNLKAISTDNAVPNAQLDKLNSSREEILNKIRKLKTQIGEIKRQEDESIREIVMEKALVSAEQSSVNLNLADMEKQLTTLQAKIYRLEAQRNSSRVMQETQQAKLKQSIDMRKDQKQKLKALLDKNPKNESLKEELSKCVESLENDRKMFEDLEFQYLEEETEWLAYREDLHNEQETLTVNIEDKRLQLQNLEIQGNDDSTISSSENDELEGKKMLILSSFQKYRDELQTVDAQISDLSGQVQSNSNSSEDEESPSSSENVPLAKMSQSLFGSAEILCSRRKVDDIMSKSINENMFYNNKIEVPMHATSTPKRLLTVVNINTEVGSKKKCDITPEVVRRKHNDTSDPILKLKYNVDAQDRLNFNLSLGSDDFEVNPLDKRIPSQDDIDRICKIAADAPISTKGASSKIFDSIKEIERNRQLLLQQQGSHVIEHERQKMMELKKKSQDEARAMYLSQISDSNSTKTEHSSSSLRNVSPSENEQLTDKENQQSGLETDQKSNQHRFSHPEFETQRSRPLSEANSELSCDFLSENAYKSTGDLTPSSILHSRSEPSTEDTKRSSVNSNETTASDKLVINKRPLPKHQRPLTRYLPIFSPDLDLRLHIESAGHQIGLCPHVHVDAYSCRGYLHKLGATFHGWSRRWFVLDRQRSAFIYYSDKSERKPRGGAYFSTIDEVYLDHLNASKSGRPHCTFIVKTKKRSYHLQAASDAAARIWIDAIITGAQGNLDY